MRDVTVAWITLLLDSVRGIEALTGDMRPRFAPRPAAAELTGRALDPAEMVSIPGVTAPVNLAPRV